MTSASASMQAVQFDGYGPPNVLYVATLDMPSPKDGQVLVKVHAASVGGGEPTIRAGKVALVMGKKFPMRTGVDFAGEVFSVGAGVTGFEVGDRVWGIMPHSTFGAIAQFVAVPAERLANAPANLTMTDAASLPAVGTTVLRALDTEGDVKRGDRVLIRGATGGVGTVAIQYAKHLGAHVTGLAGPRNQDWMREMGADEVFDYTRHQLETLGRFDVILDVVGTEMARYRRLLVPEGRFVELGFDPDHLLRTFLYIGFSQLARQRRVRAFSNNPPQPEIARLTALVESGIIRPVVEKIWLLRDVAEAHQAIESGGVRGKHVIAIE